MKAQQRGFTLWELLMTLLVAGVLLSIGVPNIRQFQRSGAMTAVANDFVTGLLTARTEAVKRQVPVTMCLSDNPFADPPVCVREPVVNSTRGFIVWAENVDGDVDALGNPDLSDSSDGDAIVDTGEPVLYRGAALDPNATIRVSTTCGHIVFNPNGWVRPGTSVCTANWTLGSTLTFVFCDDRGQRESSGQLSSARAVRIEGTGRGVMLQEPAQLTAAVTLVPGITCPL